MPADRKHEFEQLIATVIILVDKLLDEETIEKFCKKLGELPCGYKERILGQDRQTLELIVENIFEIDSLSDLDRFLKQ